MDIKEKIQTWLDSEDRNYQDGLALASQVLTNRHLVGHLHRKDHEQNRDKLQYELCNYIGAEYKPNPEVLRQAVPSVEETADGGETGTQTLGDEPENTGDEEKETPEQKAEWERYVKTQPDPVQQLYYDKRSLYGKRNEICQKMQDLTVNGTEFDQEVLEGLKQEADGYDEQIKAIDSQLEYFHQNGVLPIKAAPGETVTITEEQKKVRLEELRKLIENKQTAVSKAKSKVKKSPDNVSYATEQAKLEAELEGLRFERDTLKAQATV